MDIIVSAVIVGVFLSLVFIGPVFFLLIETSISKGWKEAVVLDLGVIFCDLLFIFIIYFSLKDVSEVVNNHPEYKNYAYRLGGLVLLIYGLTMVFKKENYRSIRRKKLKGFTGNYIVTFMNGFLLNLLNIGVIFFWFGLVSYLAVEYSSTQDFLLFISVAFGTFFTIDLLKIFLAQKMQKIVDLRFAIKLRVIMGIILIVFSALLFSKSYGAFSGIDDTMQQKLNSEIKPKS